MLRSLSWFRSPYVRFLSGLSSAQEHTECSFTKATGFLESVRIADIVKPGSLQAFQLLHIIDSIQDGHQMTKLRNRMKRKFRYNYHLIYPSLRQISDDPLRLRMTLFRNSGRKQYDTFVQCLLDIINRKDLKDEDKRQKLYDLITFQHEMYPGLHRNSGLFLPNEVHEWFWRHLPRQQSFSHYYFLIKNDVYLSGPYYSWKFVKRMLQGSEIELQLASFQLFLYEENHQSIFNEKFHKLYSFHAISLIAHRVLETKDLRFAKVYIEALLRRMETIEPGEMSFLRLNNVLLYYLSQTGDIESFLQAFEVELQFIKNVSRKKSSMLQRPLLFILKMLRKQGYHEEFFMILSILQKGSLGKSQVFKQHALTELITLLRSFNDCKLTCQYLLSGFGREATGNLLNNLGLWSSVFHENVFVLDSQDLKSEIDSFETLLPSSLSVKGLPSMAIMTELYRLILSTNAQAMNKDQYRDLLMNLYNYYIRALENDQFASPKHDTGILNVFLYNIRYSLGDPKLAFIILKDFYSRKLARNVRVTSTKCPFSIVAYQNDEISQTDINQLLILMHDAKIPLHFQFCTAMVFRYLQLDSQDEAYAWYQRILHAGFKVENRLLIKAIRDNGWPHPKGFDKSLMETLDDRYNDGIVSDDTYFLEAEDNSTTKSIEDNQEHKASLQHISELLKTL